MDPLSIAASILAVLTAAGKTAQGLEKLWGLKNASKDLLLVSSMRTMLHVVEIALHSLQGQDVGAAQSALQEIHNIRAHASKVLNQLDVLVNQKVQQAGNGSPDSPRIAKIAWMRQQRKLARLQAQVKSITQNLTTALTALNSLQIATLPKIGTAQVTVSMNEISMIENKATHAEPHSIQTQLGKVLQHVVTPGPSTFQEEKRRTSILEPVDQTGTTQAMMANLHSVLPAHAFKNTAYSTSRTVRITTTIGPGKCDRFCQCQCHVRSQLRTPNWTNRVFGSFYFQTNATMLLNRRDCNFWLCRRSGRTSAQVTWYAPSWMLMRAFYLHITRDDIGGIGGSIFLKTPRVITNQSLIWSLIGRGDERKVLDMFAKDQASVYDVDTDGESLLHYAASQLQPALCQRLIQLGADPLFTSHEGMPAFEYGLDHVFANPPSNSNVEPGIIDSFLSTFANDDAYDSLGFTPLHRVVLGLVEADLRTQIELSFSDIDTPDSGGRTPVMWAARRGDIDTLRILIECGADVNKCDRGFVAPLHKAVADGTDECVEALIAAGAKVDVEDMYKAQPIHNVFFCLRPRPRTIDALLARGANLNARNHTGCTPLHWAAGCRGEGAIDNARHLILKGADINAVNSLGFSPVMWATRRDDQRLLRCFVEHDAKLSLRREIDGANILHIVAIFGTFDCWDVLEESAKEGKMKDVDTKTLHNGHDVMACLGTCRDERFVGERADLREEIERFRKLLDTIEGTQSEAEP